MFPSSNTYDDDPFPLSTHTLPGTSLSGVKHLAAASSVLEDPPPAPFWQSPVPFIDDDAAAADGLLMSHLLSQAQQQILGSTTTNNMAPPGSEIHAANSPITKETKKVATNRKRSSSTNGAKQGIPRKRVGKKDRHSKIYTAQGPRDRRMRLSLQIARKFFDLQDMLGFDKASKTIEWLFSKSKAAIKELTENLPGMEHMSCSEGGKSMSSTSESEVVSAAKECGDNMGEQQGVIARGKSMKSTKATATATATATTRETKERKSRKVSFNDPVAKESRDKARARARERTREKMKMKGLEKPSKTSDDSSNPIELERLQSSSPLETGENSGPSTQTTSSCLKVVTEEEEQPQQSTEHWLENQMDSVSIIERFLGINRASTSSSMFNYSHNIADSSTARNSEENCAVFSGNWGMNNERIQCSYYPMRNIKEPTGNAIAREQNPSIILMTDPNGQHQKSTPILVSNSNTQGENPSSSSNLMVNNSYAKIMNHRYSDLINTSSPTSILMSTSDNIGLHSYYQENPTHVASKLYQNFY